MALCVILYKVLINEKTRVVMDYHNGQLVVWNSAVMPLVRKIEAEITPRPGVGYQQLAKVGMSVAAMNPSVLFIGLSRNNLFKWDILTDPYDIEEVTFFGSRKFVVAACDGPKAMFYWEKGVKPKLPEGNTDDSKG